MTDEHQPGCGLDDEHRDFAVFVGAHLNSYFLPLARRYAGATILDAAPDIAQEAMGIAWAKWVVDLAAHPCWRRCGFVCKTMSNLAHEERRKRHRVGLLTDPRSLPESPSRLGNPEDLYLEREAASRVEEALLALTPDERLIIDLARARLPHTHIAELLEISPSNVSTKLCRARKRLARFLDPESGSACTGGVA